jgi:hypothetical protein
MKWCEVKREVGKGEKNEILRGRIYMNSKLWEVKGWGGGGGGGGEIKYVFKKKKKKKKKKKNKFFNFDFYKYFKIFFINFCKKPPVKQFYFFC